MPAYEFWFYEILFILFFYRLSCAALWKHSGSFGESIIESPPPDCCRARKVCTEFWPRLALGAVWLIIMFLRPVLLPIRQFS